MLPDPFTTIDRTRLQLGIERSSESHPDPGPAWNESRFFEELNKSLGILNPANDPLSQLDQLMGNSVPPGTTKTYQSVSGIFGLSHSLTPIFPVLTPNEVPIKSFRSAPPVKYSTDKKLDETSWEVLVNRVQAADSV